MIIKGSEPREPTVSTQTILEMGYSRDSLTDAMKKAQAKCELFLLPTSPELECVTEIFF